MAHDTNEGVTGSEIAVIGMAGRFPGARTPDELWRNVRDGVESIRPLTDRELQASGVDRGTLRDPDYVKVCAPLDDMEQFDAGFFGFSPRDAAILDPQHRHFLECAWEALESAGHPPERFPGSIGVFAGCGMNSYFFLNLLTNPDLVRSVGMFLLRHTGNDKDFLATRVSYLLNLTGPSLSIQTACSTSLVAVHVAAQHLLSGECDLALAGGVTINLPHRVGYQYQEGEILSPDGHCRAFDAASKGTVFGSGVGVVVLRRLADALEAGDHIHAVIKGSAVNNDGATKIGYLAPSVDGQSASILEALAVAGVRAETIGYVEAHGTGTPIGDPIEVAALTQAFRQHTDRRGFCALGSLKSNVGHLDTAAGVAGLIKAIQALKHRELPPSLHFSTPNPAIAFEATPFQVNATLRPWPSDVPRRAGVSALGVGGTNAHVVLEEAPAPAPTSSARSHSLILLSAKSSSSLDRQTRRLADHFAARPDANVADAAFTTALGRRAFDLRRFAVCRGADDAASTLRQMATTAVPVTASRAQPASVVMLFPGGGAQYPNMARDLYREEPRFRATLDRCLDIVGRLGHGRLRSFLFPDSDLESAARELERPCLSVLSVFIVEYALAELWMAWGVRPAACLGHSLGEYVAAVLAGVLSIEDALAVVAKRGEIFERLPAGAMLSVALPEATFDPLVRQHGLATAAINAPDLCVASGTVGRIDALERELAARDIECRRLHIAVAAHSDVLDPFLAEFRQFVATVRLHTPSLPFISNVTGTWVDPEAVVTPEYWATHLRAPVRFSEGLSTALAEDGRVLLETGPGQALSALARVHRVDGRMPAVVTSLRHAHDATSDLQTVYSAAGQLWSLGCTLDWDAFYSGQQRRRIALPTYAFDHERHWIEPGVIGATPAPPAVDPLERLTDLADWTYVPTWLRLEPVGRDQAPRRWLVLSDGAPVGSALVAELERRGHRIAVASAGCSFAAPAPDRYAVRPTEADDYRQVIADLRRKGMGLDAVLNVWPIEVPDTSASELSAVTWHRERAFDAPIAFARALAEASDEPIDLVTLTSGAYAIADEPVRHPAQSLAMGPMLVAPREYSQMHGRVIDVLVDIDATGSSSGDGMARLAAELTRTAAPTLVALRRHGSFARSFTPRRVDDTAGNGDLLRADGVYLITGGFGGVALSIGRELARTYRARLGLVARTALPERGQWPAYLASNARRSRVRSMILAVLELEQLGATVVPLAADVTDEESLSRSVLSFEQQCGPINGVVHAAGTLEDELIALATENALHAVLSPKVDGTIVLDAVLRDRPLDFFALCSSTSALIGLPGQVGYTAANAFLDAFAHDRARRRPGRTLSVNWGTWNAVGMTARAGVAAEARRDPSESETHPLLGRTVSRTETEVVHLWTARPDAMWVLADHRLADGQALLPGAGYLEMARAAWQDLTGQDAVDVSQLVFVRPLEAPDGDVPREVRVTVRRRRENEWDFLVDSRADPTAAWEEHATAMLSASTEPTCQPPLDGVPAMSAGPGILEEIRVRCATAVPSGSPRDVWHKQSKHLRFGPRWDVVSDVRLGVREALIRLELPECFAEDATVFAAHPALLDFAAATGVAAVDDYDRSDDFFVPFSFERVTVGPLPTSLWAHATVTSVEGGAASVALDVVLYSDEGDIVGRIHRFVLRRVPLHGLERRRADATADRRAQQSYRPQQVSDLVSRLLENGIGPAAGAQALLRTLRTSLGAQVVISSVDLATIQAEVDRLHPRRSRASHGADAGATPTAAGPAATAAETAISGMWEDLLGVKGIGLDDDFFSLGGHSLLAVRLATRIKREFDTLVPLTTFFEARTVRQLASLVSPVRIEQEESGPPAPKRPHAVSGWKSLVPIRTTGSKATAIGIHGGSGQVLSYRSIAERLGAEWPFYGLQSPAGLDGVGPPYGEYATVEELAALYLEELRTVRPHGPYVILGACFGGLIALEMAQRLRRDGETVERLFILDAWLLNTGDDVGHRVDRHREALRKMTLGQKAAYLAPKVAATVQYHLQSAWTRIRHLPRRVQRSLVRASAQVTREALPQDTLKDDFNRASKVMMVKYRPEPYTGRVVLFRSATFDSNPDVGFEQVPSMGWRGIAVGDFETVDMPGDHLEMMYEPLVPALVEQMLARLERRETAVSTPAGSAALGSTLSASRPL